MWFMIEVDESENVGKDELTRLKISGNILTVATVLGVEISAIGTVVHPATKGDS